MAQHDEISSTEKLLNLIRSDQPVVDASTEQKPAPHSSTSPALVARHGRWHWRRSITVGVDIGYNALKLVKLQTTSDHNYEVLDFQSVPYEGDSLPHSPQFIQQLKLALKQFCGSQTKLDLWSAISTERVETRYLKIPKVPRKQISNAVYWTYKREIAFDEERDVFDYQILGDVVEEGVPKIEVLAYSAPHMEVQKLQQTFQRAGFPLTGITIVPFAIQNLLQTAAFPNRQQEVCSLFIGQDWSRIAIYSKGHLILSRGIKSGIKSMVEAISEGLYATPIQTETAGGNLRDLGYDDRDGRRDLHDTTHARQLFFEYLQGGRAKAQTNDGTPVPDEEIFTMIAPALNRLIRQVERTLQHYDLHFDSKGITQIYISGEISGHAKMVAYLGAQLDLPVAPIDPFTEQPRSKSMRPEPASEAERETYVPAMGLALSRRSVTPNFIFTYQDKENERRARFNNRAVFATLLLIMAACAFLYSWQGYLIDTKNSRITRLQQRIDRYIPLIDRSLIKEHIDLTMQNRDRIATFGQKYLIVAVISEITSKTPTEIRLVNLSAEMGPAGKSQAPTRKNRMLIDGIVAGERMTLESTLANYLINLKNSPLLGQPKITSKSFESQNDKEVLRFQAQIELL